MAGRRLLSATILALCNILVTVETTNISEMGSQRDDTFPLQLRVVTKGSLLEKKTSFFFLPSRLTLLTDDRS